MTTGQYPDEDSQYEIVRVMGFIAYFDSQGGRMNTGSMYEELPREHLRIRRLACGQ